MTLRTASLVIMLAAATASAAEMTADELLGAVDQMTPEQAQAFSQKLEAKLWQPVPEGFFSRMAVDMNVGGGELDKVDVGSVALSGGELDVESVDTFDVGLLWRAFSPRLHLGLRMESWMASDSNLGPGGYSRVEVEGGGVTLVANYQLVRNDAWLVWAELGGGGGGVMVDTVDTPAGEATTLRSFDQDFGMGDARLGAAWRFNRALCLQVSGGYRFAESVELDEGGSETPVTVDASGPSGRIGLGVNF